ncbi:AzlD domain-containing protein [Microcella daejeonensis]|uniref:AzlD domain-containing protein n=1 Tax=Microcella daejeonensis TaxID=2994971 RepID=A0A9E8MLT3_9MICO|nr:AzlD domain-containing protein [Microcella daejeonensis]WAB81091.1 AzlD domain-containing protein [Microcella daejeonensis]
MTVWQIILLASIAVLALKLLGYLVPPSVLEKPAAARTAQLTTVALLSALIVVQTASVGQALVVDARLPAIAVAAALLAVRAPFILVILAAALTAAALRALGWAA